MLVRELHPPVHGVLERRQPPERQDRLYFGSRKHYHPSPLLLCLRVCHEVEVPEVGGGRDELEGVPAAAAEVAHGLAAVAVQAEGGYRKRENVNNLFG